MMEWKEVEIGDYVTLRQGFAINAKSKHYISDKQTNLNLLRIADMKANNFEVFVDESIPTHFIANNEDIIYTRTGQVGLVFTNLHGVVHNNCFTVKSNDENILYREYLLYALRMPSFYKSANSLASGSAQPDLSHSAFKALKIVLPDIRSQRRIASILSSLDSKIETNKKINAKLEEMAQALFKSWFVDFEPFKDKGMVESELGMIPEGWRVGSLTEIATYTNGLAMQKFPPEDMNDSYPVLKIKELGQGCCDSSSDRCSKNIREDVIVYDGDVIFSWSGTLLVDLWCGGKCGLNQHLFKVTSNEYPKWFYLYWTKHHLNDFIRIAKDKAVTMGHIKRGHLESALVAIPNENDMKKINDILTPIVDKIVSTRVENRNLSQLRDTLLPKLMSGEISLDSLPQ